MDWRYFAILFSLPLHIFALDLDKFKSLGISETVYISDIAVFFNKAFLAIPRTGCTSNVTLPTLLDVPWKEHSNVILKSRFNKPIDGQVWANCRNLQNAISLAKEGAKSKLWILDKGNEFCPAKLRAYNMFHGIFLNDDTIELAEVAKSNLNTIVIEDEPTLGNHRAFIANAGDDKVLVCYLSALACQQLSLFSGKNSVNPVMVDLLSISRVDSRMFMTSTRSRQVYSVDLDQIDSQYAEQNGTEANVSVTLHGETLGPASALETDLRNGLIYYLTTDYAIMRWNIDKPMTAEHHDVLAQSFDTLPYVSKIFTDPQGNILALTNLFDPSNCLNATEQFALKRAVRIIKYSWILDKYI